MPSVSALARAAGAHADTREVANGTDRGIRYVVTALAVAFSMLSLLGAEARGNGVAHRPAGPRLLAGEIVESKAGDRLLLRFSERVSFPGMRRGDRLVTVTGYRVGQVDRAHRTRWMTVRLLGTSSSAAVPDRVRLLQPHRGPWIRDTAGRRALPGSAPLSHQSGSLSRTKPTSGSSGTSSISSTTSSSSTTTTTSSPVWYTLANPIDPTQQTALQFGDRSHWLQPWRAYLDTPAAAVLRDAVGINFNVPAQSADATARLLASSGFRRARLEIGWDSMSFADPSQLRDPTAVDTRLAALKANGIRPLILLNANDHAPGPTRFFTAQIVQPAAAGAQRVQVDATTASQIVPGYSGLNGPTGTAAEFIATSVAPGGWVQLSKPLPAAMPAGSYPAATVRFQPFAAPFTSSGSPNPVFEETIKGWLQYVQAVTSEAKRVLGSDAFDVEVWNELSFGSNFLFIDRYYNPVPSTFQGAGDVQRQILVRTVNYLRDPANGVPGVGIGNGFANQTPFAAGSTSPAGLTAIDKHPYHANVKTFPQDQVFNGVRPVDALANLEGTLDSFGNWHDPFIPSYRAFF